MGYRCHRARLALKALVPSGKFGLADIEFKGRPSGLDTPLLRHRAGADLKLNSGPHDLESATIQLGLAQTFAPCLHPRP